MKTYALVVLGLLTSVPLAANAENAQQGPVALDAVQLDSVTAAGFTLPGTSIAVQALADAIGKVSLTGTRTLTSVRGFSTPFGFGFGRNFAISSGALATATGDESRDTSYSSSEDANGTTQLGVTFNRTKTVGPTTITGYSSLQPTGLMAHNVLSRIGEFFRR